MLNASVLLERLLERLRNDNTTATQRSEQKGDPQWEIPISQLQLNFFTIREIPCVVLPLRCHFVISLLRNENEDKTETHD